MSDTFPPRRRLGRAGPEVSALGLGCMGMSGTYGARDEAQSIATLHRARDLGITFFDTADIYGAGHNEELLGRAFAGRFGDIVIASKCGNVLNAGQRGVVDGSPAYIRAACDASLKRLGVETIDLYYLHRADSKTPIEDSVGALADLVRAGKIHYIGLSEVSAATLRRAQKIYPVTALQTEYSVFSRHVEAEILPTCRALGIGFVPYSPLGRGMLTQAFRSGTNLVVDDPRARIMPRFTTENAARNRRLLDEIEVVAARHSASLSQIAIAWVLAQGDDIVPIPGTTKTERLAENLGALSIHLTADECATLSKLAQHVQGGREHTAWNTNIEVETPLRA